MKMIKKYNTNLLNKKTDDKDEEEEVENVENNYDPKESTSMLAHTVSLTDEKNTAELEGEEESSYTQIHSDSKSTTADDVAAEIAAGGPTDSTAGVSCDDIDGNSTSV